MFLTIIYVCNSVCKVQGLVHLLMPSMYCSLITTILYFDFQFFRFQFRTILENSQISFQILYTFIRRQYCTTVFIKCHCLSTECLVCLHKKYFTSKVFQGFDCSGDEIFTFLICNHRQILSRSFKDICWKDIE